MKRNEEMWKAVEEEYGFLSVRESLLTQKAMNWAYNTMMERATNWLCMNMTSVEYFGINGNISKPAFIRQFKEAMKRE